MSLGLHLVILRVTESQAQTFGSFKLSFIREVHLICSQLGAGRGNNGTKFFSLITVNNFMSHGGLSAERNSCLGLVQSAFGHRGGLHE